MKKPNLEFHKETLITIAICAAALIIDYVLHTELGVKFMGI